MDLLLLRATINHRLRIKLCMTVYRGGGIYKWHWLDTFKNAFINPYMTAIAMWSMVFGVRLLFDQNSLFTLNYLPDLFVYLWSGIFFLGGWLMLHGSAFLKTKYQAAGAAMFATASFTAAACIIMAPPPNDHWPAVHLALFGAASLLRLKHLMKGELLLWVREKQDHV